MIETKTRVEDVLETHGINCPIACFICKQQKSNLEINSAVHADIAVITDPDSGIQFVEKTFGRKRDIPLWVANGLITDYQEMYDDYERLGIQHLAANYNLKANPQEQKAEFIVEQLYFPEGTALDWLKSGESVQDVVHSIAADCLIPTLTATDSRIRDEESWIFLDASLKNFAVLEDEGEIKAFYLDFWVPRVREIDGEIKTYPDFHPHKIPEEEVRQRFFSKAGIIQNFIRKSWQDLQDSPRSRTEFATALDVELEIYLNTYFPDLTVEEIGMPNT